jgi:hypothetical protein
MNKYIQDWLNVIEYMNNDNTYKLAWGRAILENVYTLNHIEENNVITFDAIAHKMVKYYWNQTFFFNLRQGSNIKKKPVIVQQVDLLIDKYKELTGSSIPIWFDKAEEELTKKQDFYKSVLKKCARKLKDDVSWRFMNVNKEKKDLYVLNKDYLYISINKEQVLLLKEYGFVLSQLLNYKWAQLLEKFNNAPRITSKVKGISDNQIRRNNLTKYKNILLENMNKPIDFYTGDELDMDDISVDHVIPWSFMYSDDIWNLVLTSKSHNSSKSNHIPSKEVIEQLNKRNKALIETINNSKYKEELNIAIMNNYVDKFYLSMKL